MLLLAGCWRARLSLNGRMGRQTAINEYDAQMPQERIKGKREYPRPRKECIDLT